MKSDTICIVGVAESDEIGDLPNSSALELQTQAARNALADAGLQKRDVDGLITQTGGRMPAINFAEYMGLEPRWVDETFIGGASNVSHIDIAAAAIAAGICTTILVAYGATPRQGEYVSLTPEYADDFERPFGTCFPIGAYALAARRHMYQFGTKRSQFAKLVVESRRWAALNPRAMRRNAITVEDVLSAPAVVEPIHRLDSCLVTDAGGAFVMTTFDRARHLRKKPVAFLGAGHSFTHRSIAQKRDVTTSGAVFSAPRALQRSGLSLNEIDVFEVYDAFSSQLLIVLEDIGLCKKGEGGAFVDETDFGPDGDIALNTSGGGLSYLHPGQFGMFLVIEAVRQLRGECGERQVRDAKHALVHGNGGVFFSEVTAILGTPD